MLDFGDLAAVLVARVLEPGASPTSIITNNQHKFYTSKIITMGKSMSVTAEPTAEQQAEQQAWAEISLLQPPKRQGIFIRTQSLPYADLPTQRLPYAYGKH